jgi:urea transport system ATP-binding protein
VKLEIDDVRIAYGRTEVVFGVSLEVPDGSLTCLMGRNGVGKTTLLNGIMGVLPLRSGSVCLDGRDIGGLKTPQRARAGIGYVPQGHQVFPHLTAWENLQVLVERDRRGDPTAIEEALDVFPTLRKLIQRPAGLLSGGQAQQLAIEGIQPSIILEIEDAIAELHRSGAMTILLVEQYVEFALRLAERYAVMDGGLITHTGATSDVELSSFSDLLAV